MSGIDLLLNYFPDLGERQKEQYAAMEGLYSEWNEKINVISRKDMENFYEHHVLHSLAIAKVQPFKPMAEILPILRLFFEKVRMSYGYRFIWGGKERF